MYDSNFNFRGFTSFREKYLASVLENVRLHLLSETMVTKLDEKLASVEPATNCKALPQPETNRAKNSECC